MAEGEQPGYGGDPSRKLTEAEKKRYVEERYCHCPYCDCTSLDVDDPEYGLNEISQDMYCQDCGRSWTDVYRLVAVEEKDAGVRYDFADGSADDDDEEDECGECGVSEMTYARRVANGVVYRCKHCGEETLLDDEDDDND